MHDVLSYLPDFADALLVTLGISLAAAVIGLALGFGLNALRLRVPGFALVYRVYVWLIRGTPFLAQLAVIYFGLPAIGLRDQEELDEPLHQELPSLGVGHGE